jgi:hypothetical protein
MDVVEPMGWAEAIGPRRPRAMRRVAFSPGKGLERGRAIGVDRGAAGAASALCSRLRRHLPGYRHHPGIVDGPPGVLPASLAVFPDWSAARPPPEDAGVALRPGRRRACGAYAALAFGCTSAE